MSSKRKAVSSLKAEDKKKIKVVNVVNGSMVSLREPHFSAAESEEHGIVLRRYYPREMNNARAQAYNDGILPRPMDQLGEALEATASARKTVPVQHAVAHWFKTDLRLDDNRALSLASQKAAEKGVPLICFYLVSPEDLEAHLRAPVRVDFILRTLHVLKRDLAALGIPLYVETVEKRKQIPARVVELLGQWGASHLFVNIEYEVDELRRDTKMVRLCANKGIDMQAVHDACVVAPGALQTGTGKQYSVYSPWFRAWKTHVQANPDLLETFGGPRTNPQEARTRLAALFDCAIPEAPVTKRLTEVEAKRFHALWPAGEHEARARLAKFCEERIGQYHSKRNIPAEVGTACVSVHLAAGTLSARTCVKYAREHNTTRKLDGGAEGIQVWISEVAWRDFYKHVLAHWPYVCMNKPWKPAYSNISWSYDEDMLEAWKTGRTGFPIVDAAMRQMLETGWMHNRCRMIVASFLAKDLCLDWRLGERFFMEHLVDGDFASNNGGWGFCASTGVDPQPYFRIFNPLLQSEKFDPSGEYIRRWVPELRGIVGKAIHDPYGRAAADKAAKAGYPRPVVDHKESRARALEMYKAGLAKES